MAYQQVQLLAVLATVACLASVASATVYVVGDHDCWGSNFAATHWADNKTFYVGDSLMFFYSKGSHTVAQVGEEDFAACNVDANFIGGVLNSTFDVVKLQKPGKMWFICTKPNHCLKGMKLAINVEDVALTPDAPPSSAPVSYAVGSAVAAVAGAVVAAVLAF